MNIAFIFVFLILNLVIHEAAHAIAMRRYGVEIKEAGLGIPIPGFIFRFRVPWLSFPLTLSPILLGAYVEPTPRGNQQTNALPYRERALIFGAGVLGNVLVGSLLTIIALFIFKDLGEPAVYIRLIAMTAIALVIVRFSKLFCSIGIPILGLAFVGLLLYTLIPGLIENFQESALHGGAPADKDPILIGPIGITHEATTLKTAIEVFRLAVAISFGIGIFNMLPLLPLDGGRIFGMIIERVLGKQALPLFGLVSIVAIVTLIFLIFAGDINRFL